MTLRIDLNADLGEGMAHDEAIIALVSSANIACGGHAGDAVSMRACLALAKQYGVTAGAHPSYPDKENFGRKTLPIEDSALRGALTEQIAQPSDLAQEVGGALSHVKPHGALYNDAAVSPRLAEIVVSCAQEVTPGAALFGPPNSALEQAANAKGVTFVAEGFADRAYLADGRLAPRSQPGAVLESPDKAARQAVVLAKGEEVRTLSNEVIRLNVATICLHGDDLGALERAQATRAALLTSGVKIQSFAR